MKKNIVICICLSILAVLCFGAGCAKKEYGLENLNDFHIKASEQSYDFLANLETELEKEEIVIDSSSVQFGVAGEYEVRIEYKGESVTKKCYIYGMPVIEGEPEAVSYAQAAAGEILSGLTAKDSFNNVLTVTVEEGIAKDASGLISYGSNPVSYAASDRAGNKTVVEKQITVNETSRPQFDNVSIDIADGNYSLNLGETGSVRVFVDEEELSAAEYTARNGVLILFDRYLATLNYGVGHEVIISEENAGWNSFTLTVGDDKPLYYEAPVGEGYTYAAGDIRLPAVEIGNPLQEHQIYYSIVEPGSTEATSLAEPILEDAAAGEYGYTIRITRKNQEILNKTFRITVLTQDEYDSIIFNADSDQFMGNLYVDETLDMPSLWELKSNDYGGKYTDSQNVTKNAARFSKRIVDMNYQRDLYITEEAIARMLGAGYKTLTIELCFVTQNGTPQVQVLGNTTGKNTDQWTNIENNKWVSILFDMSKLYENYKAGMSGMFGGFRFIYQPGDGNEPFQVYVSSITAGYLYQGIATYSGTYTESGENSIEILPDGTAQISGKNSGRYTVSVTDENEICFESGSKVVKGYADAGILILDGLMYTLLQTSGYNVLAGVAELPRFAAAFADAGYRTDYYTVNDGSETPVESFEKTMQAGETIALRVKIFNGTEEIGAVTRNVTAMDEYDYYSQNLATAENIGKFVMHGPANSIYAVTHTDKSSVEKDGLCFVNTYIDGSNSYVFSLDPEFVQGAIRAGFTGIKLTYNIPELGSELRLGEWLKAGGWDWQNPLGYASASSVWQNDDKWEPMSMLKLITSIASDSTLLVHLNVAGSFYIADMCLIKTVPTESEFEKDFSASASNLLYLWQYDTRNSVLYESHEDKNGVLKEGIHLVNNCYQNTDSSRTFKLGEADLVAKAKELGYTKMTFDICLPVLNTEMFGPGNFYFGASPVWSNDNVWESKEVSLADLTLMDMTFTGQDAYIANIRFK